MSSQPQIPDPTHQDKDINLTAVTLSILGVFLTVVISMVAMAALFGVYKKNMYDKREPVSALGAERQIPTESPLQVDEVADLEAWLEQENQLLESYEMISEQSGTARVPLEVAKQVLLSKGYRPVLTAPPAEAAPPAQAAAPAQAPAPEPKPAAEAAVGQAVAPEPVASEAGHE